MIGLRFTSTNCLFLAALSLLSACVSAETTGPVDPALRPENMFAGQHVGQGVLTFRNGEIDRRFTVYSNGRRTADGGLELEQDIHYADGEKKTRQWSFTPETDREMSATLSDAGGTVRLTVHEDRLSLNYPVNDLPFGRIDQSLYLSGSGSIINEGRVTVLGYTVRYLHEQIVPMQAE